MKIILFLIIISIAVALIFLIAFFWAVRDGQYDDDYTPSIRILLEDDIIENSENLNYNSKK
jgi:cbb3-type cytochrome oxidase maturation protein